MPIQIQIIITAENAAEANQLVQDLAGTMSNMDLADIPEKTEVSTIRLEPRHAPIQNQHQELPTAVPTAPMQQAPQPNLQAVPTTAPSYTKDQLAVASTQLVDAGRREALVQLLYSFGVQALTALPKEQYGAFATKLREMGAKM